MEADEIIFFTQLRFSLWHLSSHLLISARVSQRVSFLISLCISGHISSHRVQLSLGARGSKNDSSSHTSVGHLLINSSCIGIGIRLPLAMCDPCAVPLDSGRVVVLAISSSGRDSIMPSLWHFSFTTFDLAHETSRGIVDDTDVAYCCVLWYLFPQRRSRRNVPPLQLCFRSTNPSSQDTCKEFVITP